VIGLLTLEDYTSTSTLLHVIRDTHPWGRTGTTRVTMTVDDGTGAQTTTSTIHKGTSDVPGNCSEMRISSWVNRFAGVPPDRASSVAHALERAETYYANDTNRDVAVFDSVIQRAMMSDCGTISVRSNMVGSKATIATARSSPSLESKSKSLISHTSKDIGTSNLSDLMEVLADSTNNCFANQRDEIICLRLAVKELIIELMQQTQQLSQQRVPNVIEIQDRSAIDEDSVKEISVDFQSRDESGTPSRIRERNFHPNATATGLSKGASTLTSRSRCNSNDPEGLYTPHQRDGWGKRLDPPCSIPKSSFNENGRLHSAVFPSDAPTQHHTTVRESSLPLSHVHPFDKTTSLEDQLHDKLNDVRRRILASTPPKWDDPKEIVDSSDLEPPPFNGKARDANQYSSDTTPSSGGPNTMHSTFEKGPSRRKASISPAMERARGLVIERRQRFRNFHRAHELHAKQHPEPKTRLLQLLPQTPLPSKEGLLASPNGDDQQEPLSPFVCLREDDLTLMETTAKTNANRRDNHYLSY
jgi:hypothetical protein